ncbi:MAG: hypothetical protein WAM58_13720 [Candidatus Acidiferrum sp.]
MRTETRMAIQQSRPALQSDERGVGVRYENKVLGFSSTANEAGGIEPQYCLRVGPAGTA